MKTVAKVQPKVETDDYTPEQRTWIQSKLREAEESSEPAIPYNDNYIRDVWREAKKLAKSRNR